jgi:hypothetical protein
MGKKMRPSESKIQNDSLLSIFLFLSGFKIVFDSVGIKKLKTHY